MYEGEVTELTPEFTESEVRELISLVQALEVTASPPGHVC